MRFAFHTEFVDGLRYTFLLHRVRTVIQSEPLDFQRRRRRAPEDLARVEIPSVLMVLFSVLILLHIWVASTVQRVISDPVLLIKHICVRMFAE